MVINNSMISFPVVLKDSGQKEFDMGKRKIVVGWWVMCLISVLFPGMLAGYPRGVVQLGAGNYCLEPQG